MVDQTTQRTTINASPSQVFEVLTDFDRYPRWARDIKEATVVERDDQGQATKVRFRAAAMGRSTTYTLAYDYSEAPSVLSWRLHQGDIMRRLDGSYSFVAVENDTLATDVVYRLSVDLIVPLPGFVKRRAESRVINTALRELKAWVEAARAP